jgi:hypothetical protein
MESGLIGAIARMGEINKGKSDLETHKLVRQIIKAMTEKKRKEWPDKKLREIVNTMDSLQRKLFLETLKDMDEVIVEAYQIVENNLEV